MTSSIIGYGAKTTRTLLTLPSASPTGLLGRLPSPTLSDVASIETTYPILTSTAKCIPLHLQVPLPHLPCPPDPVPSVVDLDSGCVDGYGSLMKDSW